MGHGTVNRWEMAASQLLARRREARPARTPRPPEPLPVWEAEAVFDVADPSREWGLRTKRLKAEVQARTRSEARATLKELWAGRLPLGRLPVGSDLRLRRRA